MESTYVTPVITYGAYNYEVTYHDNTKTYIRADKLTVDGLVANFLRKDGDNRYELIGVATDYKLIARIG